jgi:hypothetical protein
MTETQPLETTALMEAAKASDHGEAYRTLDKNPNFRIGVGARLTPPNPPYFFVEIVIYLCPSFRNADLTVLEKGLACLKELKSENYTLTCQDGSCVSCETTVPLARLAEEYDKVKTLMSASFS